MPKAWILTSVQFQHVAVQPRRRQEPRLFIHPLSVGAQL
jgi:hypothetical protein